MKIIIANWKMNKQLVGSIELASNIRDTISTNPVNCEVVLCPSFPYLKTISDIIKHSTIKLGGQDCSSVTEGAYTGDISASMLTDCGCQYVILGHSERRIYHNEIAETIKQKAETAHHNNLIAIICVGENTLERNDKLTDQVIKEQLLHSLPLSFNENNTIIAYEPVWAIGTGKNPTSEEINKVNTSITQLVNEFAAINGIVLEKKIKIIYGGSVKTDNCTHLLNTTTSDGFLVGGASLVYEEFYNILTQI